VDLSSNLDAVSAILQICLIDLLLSGDNAIVIAMACATLPAAVRPRAVLLGTGAAVFFRVVLTFVATFMLRAPYLKLIGAGLLLLIAIELLAGESGTGGAAGRRAADGGIWRAVAVIVVADAVMSLDNVVAVAAAAQDNLLYLIIGLVISVPILVFSSLFIGRLLDRHPLIIDAGAALLGWIAGKIAVADPAIADVLQMQSFGLVAAAPLLGALYVVIQGRRLRKERTGAAGNASARPEPQGAAAALLVGAGNATKPLATTTAVVPNAAPETAMRPAAAPAPEAAAPATAASAGVPTTVPASDTDGTVVIPELDLPRRLSKMDLTILGGVAVPFLGLIAMIIYFVMHAASSH
jgi:YjbE family integral membrane protein